MCVLHLSCLFYIVQQEICSVSIVLEMVLLPLSQATEDRKLDPSGSDCPAPLPLAGWLACCSLLLWPSRWLLGEAPGHFLWSPSTPWSVRLDVWIWLVKLCKRHFWWGCDHKIDLSTYSLVGKRIDSDWPMQTTTLLWSPAASGKRHSVRPALQCLGMNQLPLVEFSFDLL